MDPVKALDRLDRLIAKGESVLRTHRPNPPNVIGFPTLDPAAFAEWRNQSLAFLESLFGGGHVYVENFKEQVKRSSSGQVKAGIGILRGAKEDVAAGHLPNVQPDRAPTSERPVPVPIPILIEGAKPAGQIDVIVSWSGRASHEVAKAIYEWLRDVLPDIRPWISSEDIAKGTRWFPELMKQLEKTANCILCLTPENVGSKWIHYEAGAIAGKRGDAKVYPYLVGMDVAVLKDSPLAQFQATAATKEDTWRLVRDMNSTLLNPHQEKILKGHFNEQWKILARKLRRIVAGCKEDPEERDEDSEIPTGLSSCAIDMLREAATAPTQRGVVMMLESGHVQAGSKTFANGQNIQAAAVSRDAVHELVSNRLVEDRAGLGQIFFLTGTGFTLGRDIASKEWPRLNDEDIRCRLSAWMDHRTTDDNCQEINYAELEQDLALPPGSVERLLESVARALGYETEQKGPAAIKFTHKKPQ
jgi:hypothetical protein